MSPLCVRNYPKVDFLVLLRGTCLTEAIDMQAILRTSGLRTSQGIEGLSVMLRQAS